MLRATLKSLLSRKLRLLLSGVAVVLAVMFVSGAFVLTDTLQRSFDALYANVYSYIDIEVTGKATVADAQNGGVPTNIPASVVDEIKRDTPGVRDAKGTVFADGARVVGKNGKVVPGATAPHFGAGWAGEDKLVKLRTGSGPTAPDEIAINATLAKAGNFKVGDRVGVLTLEPQKTFTIVGVFGYAGGRDSVGGEQTVAFTVPVAQELMLRQKDAYSSIEVSVADKKNLTAVRDAVRAKLGAGYVVETGKDQSKKASDALKPFLRGFNILLLAFAGVSLLVGVFLILNTFSIIVAQRTQELALLRAMGASRGQLIRSVLLESAIVGVLASAVGYGVGIGLGAVAAFALANFFGGMEIAGLGTPLIGLLASLVLGVGVTMISALIPAARAARVAPVAAMREAATPDLPLTRLTVAGTAVLAAGGGTLAFGLSGRAQGNTVWTILAGVLITFIGVALLTPLLSRPVVSLLGVLFAWSLPGQLGRRNSARNPRRTAITAAAMMIGIALITALSTVGASLKSSVSTILDRQLQADLVIAGQQTSAIPPTIDPAAIKRVRELPGIATVAVDSYDFAKINGTDTVVLAWDNLDAARAVLALKAKEGNIDSLGSGEVLIDERTAKQRKVATGSTLRLQLQRGAERTYRVVGVFRDTQIANGVVVPWSDAVAGFRSDQPVQAFAKLRPGTSATKIKQQVDDILKDSPEVTVQTRDEYAGQSTRFIDIFLGVVQVLLLVALAIAVLGIINTLLLSVLERTRELGLLRAIGLRRSQTLRMVTVESVVISLFGALLGIGVGVGLGAAVVRALKDFGFTELAFPWVLMAVYVVAAAVVGVVAALIPAIRAARLNVLNAIAYE